MGEAREERSTASGGDAGLRPRVAAAGPFSTAVDLTFGNPLTARGKNCP